MAVVSPRTGAKLPLLRYGLSAGVARADDLVDVLLDRV
jgi:hypothetical protein